MCYFQAPMLQFIIIFMYSPQYRFYYSLFCSYGWLLSWAALIWLITYFYIFQMNFWLFIIYKIAFQCFDISLSIAALFRYVGIMSYFYYDACYNNRAYYIYNAKLTLLRAIPNLRFFLQIHARLLKVSTLSLPSVLRSLRYLCSCGVISRSTALENSLMSTCQSYYLKFYMVTLLIFWTKPMIYFYKENSCQTQAMVMCFFQMKAIEMLTSFYSFKRHSKVMSSPRQRILCITLQSNVITVISDSEFFFIVDSSLLRIVYDGDMSLLTVGLSFIFCVDLVAVRDCGLVFDTQKFIDVFEGLLSWVVVGWGIGGRLMGRQARSYLKDCLAGTGLLTSYALTSIWLFYQCQCLV